MDKIKEKGNEIAPLNPGWIKGCKECKGYNCEFARIIVFYLLNTPCPNISASSIELSAYGWSNKIWKNDVLKNKLFKVANLERNHTLFFVKRTSEMKFTCEKAKMKKGFHEKREVEKIVAFKNSGYNEFMSILYHLRNSFAHGRFTIYGSLNDRIYVLEDGIKRNGVYCVRARMILKESTLLEWIDILQRK